MSIEVGVGVAILLIGMFVISGAAGGVAIFIVKKVGGDDFIQGWLGATSMLAAWQGLTTILEGLK